MATKSLKVLLSNILSSLRDSLNSVVVVLLLPTSTVVLTRRALRDALCSTIPVGSFEPGTLEFIGQSYDCYAASADVSPANGGACWEGAPRPGAPRNSDGAKLANGGNVRPG